MSSMPVGAPLRSGNWPREPRPWTKAELAQLDEPLKLLEDAEPHTKLGQQVRRLEQHGLHKTSRAVKACGRIGEKWTYACGRSAVQKIIRSHRRFCCRRCDRYVATKLFDEHRTYRERLHPAGTLYLITVRSDRGLLSPEGIRDFEESLVRAVRQLLNGHRGWGFKSLTHYEDGYPVAKGILALPPGGSLPFATLSIPHTKCGIGGGVSVSGFDAMLADILRPTLTEGHGLLRADLMAAFQGGNHFRSLGIFYGLVSKKRRERKQENLHLTTDPIGAGSEKSQNVITSMEPSCPFCGPSCRRTLVSVEPMSELQEIPQLERPVADVVWDMMRELLLRRHAFWRPSEKLRE